MRSRARSERLDLARDLPTNAKDNEALRHAKTAHSLDLEDYLRFLDQLPPPTLRDLRAKRGPRADQPFALV